MNQENNIIEKFEIIKRRQYIVTVPIFISIFLLIMSAENPEFELFGLSNSVLMTIGIVGSLCGLVFSLVNWRCPACNGYFRKEINPKFCAKCGVKLQD